MTSNSALLDVHGTQFKLNEEGRLEDNSFWTTEICNALADADGLTLTDDHWQIINLLRDFYSEYNHSPIMKLFLKKVDSTLDSKFSNQDFLNSLFPDGLLIQSTKIAGVPSPHKASLIQDTGTQEKVSVDATLSNQQLEEFEFEGNIYHLTRDGNLIENYAWSEKMGLFLAAKENITLSDDHWVVINFLHDFYAEYLISPMIKLLMKHIRKEIGAEKANKEYLYQLFPDGPSKQGSRIAGLPQPAGCID